MPNLEDKCNREDAKKDIYEREDLQEEEEEEIKTEAKISSLQLNKKIISNKN